MAMTRQVYERYLETLADRIAADEKVVRRGDVLLAANTDEFVVRFGIDDRAMPPNIARASIGYEATRSALGGSTRSEDVIVAAFRAACFDARGKAAS